MTDRTRRDLLRVGSGIAGAATLGGLAGCIDSFSGSGDGGGGSVPDHARWVPSPAAFDLGSDPWLSALHLDVADVLDGEGSLDADTVEDLRSGLSTFPGVPSVESVDSLASLVGPEVALTYVVEGSFSADEAVDAMGSAGDPESAGEYQGYTFYQPGRAASAVADGVVLLALPDGTDGDPRAHLETVVDAERGEAERLSDANDDVRRVYGEFDDPLSSAVGIPDESNYRSIDAGPITATGASTSLDGDTARLARTFVYESADAVDADAVESAAENGDLGPGFEDPSVSTSGRVVTLSGTKPASELTPAEFVLGVGGGGDDTPTPSVAFAWNYDREAGTLEIAHHGGDTLNEENTASLRYGVEGTDLREWPLPVSAGDSVTLQGEFESGDLARVIWEAPGGGRTATLGEFRIP